MAHGRASIVSQITRTGRCGAVAVADGRCVHPKRTPRRTIATSVSVTEVLFNTSVSVTKVRFSTSVSITKVLFSTSVSVTKVHFSTSVSITKVLFSTSVSVGKCYQGAKTAHSERMRAKTVHAATTHTKTAQAERMRTKTVHAGMPVCRYAGMQVCPKIIPI